jgi:2,3-bisphosphoglycerate-dependent phosphoglycerate mutase
MHQPPNATLSELGKKQALGLAERISHLNVDKIISSTHTRAVETTDIINKKLNKKVIHSELFVENKRPTEVENESHRDPEVLAIHEKIMENFSDPSWHYSDEENYYDVLDRALKAVEFLEKQKSEHVLVVTHGTFLKMLIGVMIFGFDLAPSMGARMGDVLHMNNTGVTIAEFKYGKWRIRTWNDIAHLAE